jgi:hypothetical protein
MAVLALATVLALQQTIGECPAALEVRLEVEPAEAMAMLALAQVVAVEVILQIHLVEMVAMVFPAAVAVALELLRQETTQVEMAATD